MSETLKAKNEVTHQGHLFTHQGQPGMTSCALTVEAPLGGAIGTHIEMFLK